MRVLELGKFYPPDRGGMETALEDASSGLVGLGHEVTVIVAAGETAAGTWQLQPGLTLERLARRGTVRSVPVIPGAVGAIRRWLRQFDPHVVHLHLPNPGMGLAWLLANDRRPLVITFHSEIVRQRLLRRLWEPWRSRLLNQATTIIATSQGLVDATPVLASRRGRCEVVPLGVDVERFANAESSMVRTCHDQWGERFLLFVGRHVYYKGMPVLLRALRGTPMPLVVVGDGPMRAEWETFAGIHDLRHQVFFVGRVEEDWLRAMYHACTALVLPSTEPAEAFGIVQLEAMAAGRPVVTTRVSPGVESVPVHGETGLLVPPGDADGLRRALQSLWDDPAKADAMGHAGRSRVLAFYDTRRVTKRLADCLQRAAGLSTAP